MPEPTTFPLERAYWPAAGTAAGLRETTIGSVLRDAAGRAPDATALIDGDPDRPGQRQWTYAGLLADAERAARALLTRFTPGERVAVWAPNSPEWIILEFGAALAGLTLVTVNPAYQGDELAHVLGHSEADGLFLADRFQQRDLAAVLAEVRGRLPRLRDVLSFGDWDAFTATGDSPAAAGRPLPRRRPRQPGAGAVHLGHHGHAQGRGAHPPGPHQQRAAGLRGRRHRARRRRDQPDAAVPRGRQRAVHPRAGPGHGHPGAHAPVLPRPRA